METIGFPGRYIHPAYYVYLSQSYFMPNCEHNTSVPHHDKLDHFIVLTSSPPREVQ